MTPPHILFPDQAPPAFPGRATLHDGFIWLLGVMDYEDPSRRFVASVYTQFLDKGGISEKQFASIQKVLGKTIQRFHDGVLICQGAEMFHAEAEISLGEVVPFRRLSDEVME